MKAQILKVEMGETATVSIEVPVSIELAMKIVDRMRRKGPMIEISLGEEPTNRDIVALILALNMNRDSNAMANEILLRFA